MPAQSSIRFRVPAAVTSLEDFRKLKIRSSGTLQRFLTEAGAAASYLPGPEIYPALSTGVINDVHWGAVQGANSMGLYEAAKHHVKPALNIAGTDAFIINQKSLDKLPPEVLAHMTQIAVQQWKVEGKKGPMAQKALETLKAFLTELGYVK